MSRRRTRLLLEIALTDSTFAPANQRGERVWSGRCIHCRSRLVLTLAGAPLNGATIEHIVPRHHGGTDAVTNLAAACARCNQGKGTRLDHRRRDDPDLCRMIDRLQAERAARWRDPDTAPDPLAPPPR